MSKLKNNKLFLITVFMFVVFISSSVIVSISIASEGSKFLSLEDEINKVETENRDIRSQLVKEDSLTKLSEKVEEMGLSKPEKIIYLNEEKPLVAKLP
jgi:cell division protein FtsL